VERKQFTVESDLLEFEPPDVAYLHIRFHQTVDGARRIMELMSQAASECGRLLIVVAILEEKVSVAPEVRKFYSSHAPAWRAIVVVGGSLALRTMINLIVHSMILLKSTRLPPTKFVKGLDEVNAAIAELRKSEERASSADS
jgi:hypothetical protein